MALRDYFKDNEIHFTVIVLPILKPYDDWSPKEKRSRSTILEMLQQLGLRTFDLFDPLNEAIQQGVTIQQEPPHDPWHPSSEVSLYFANYLHEKGILSSSPN